MKHVLKRGCSASALLLGLSVSTAALAQVAAADQTSSAPANAAFASDQSEIVVTARLRNEKLQDVPMMVEAFNAQRLKDNNIRDVSDFIAQTPNISITQSQNIGTQFVTVRGISQVRNGENPVAIVVDGVQQVSSAQFAQDLYGLQSIEVVTGPQGALYGRNAIGGAIIINTMQPTDHLAGDIDVSGGNGNDYRAHATVSGPLTDNIRGLIAGGYRHFGGYFDNIFLNKKQDPATDANVRAVLDAEIAPNLNANFKVQYDRATGGALNFHWQAANTLPGRPCFIDPVNPFNFARFDANDVNRNFCSSMIGQAKRELFDASFKLTYQANFGTIRNIVAYDSVWNFYGGTQAPYLASVNVPAGTNGTATQFERVKALSDEFRITSNEDAPIRWMVGTYYLDTRRFASITSGIGDPNGSLTRVTYVPIYTGPNPTSTFLGERDHNIASAFFGNASYNIAKDLELAAAIRYDVDQREQFVEPYQTGVVPPGCTVSAQQSCYKRATYSLLQPKVSLRYKVTPDISIFADWGTGFRSGQFNPSGTAAAAAANGILGVTDQLKQEEARTVEVGFKSDFFNHALRLSGTWYSTQDKNGLFFFFFAPTSQQILENIDKVHNTGFELQLDYKPIKQLEFFGNFGMTDAKIKAFVADPTAVGNNAPYVAKNTWTVGVITHLPITEQIGVFGRADVEGHGRQYWDPENSVSRNPYQLVNVSFGVEGPGSRWSLTANVNNLLDKKYNAEYVASGFVQPAIPRNWNVELKYKF